MRRLARRTRIVAIGVMIVAGVALPARSSFAAHQPNSHVKGTFPNHGFLWLDDLASNPAELYLASDKCKSAEAAAWNKVHVGLPGGATEFKGAWPGGISFYAYGCTSTVSNGTDIMLDYMTASVWASTGHGEYGGHHHYSLGSAGWCAIWYVSHPCGYHISRIHINEPRFDSYSTTYKANFLVHETGHSMGFYDYCGHTSVSNNGQLCAMTTGYLSVDRKMIRDVVYKNSPVYP
ncbi:MAG: hypothetical protein ACRDKS_07890 [Actinomycetota bacterium]